MLHMLQKYTNKYSIEVMKHKSLTKKILFEQRDIDPKKKRKEIIQQQNR